jgi:putative hemolysin
MFSQTRFILGLVVLSLSVAACSAPPSATPPSDSSTANPASENCAKQGGTVSIQKRGDGGEYGVCMFADNMQCEEWAMLNGDCPVGGIKVTGYVTPAAQYCAITGGTYAVTDNSNTPNETGTCTFKAGTMCDAAAYYNGTCTATESTRADVIMTLERTACHGTCPVYKLTITGDGTVVYEGRDFVEVKGQQTSSISTAQVQDLLAAFEQANFLTLTDYTEQKVTDLPSAITSITRGGQTKTVNHYYGDDSAPQQLTDLESKIDEITNSKQWTGK